MHRRIIPFAFPGNTVPIATFAGERSSPLLANALLSDTVPKAAFTSSAPARHLAAKAEGLHRALAWRQFHTFIAAKSPPCLKGGRGDSVSLPRQHLVKENTICPRQMVFSFTVKFALRASEIASR